MIGHERSEATGCEWLAMRPLDDFNNEE